MAYHSHHLTQNLPSPLLITEIFFHFFIPVSLFVLSLLNKKKIFLMGYMCKRQKFKQYRKEVCRPSGEEL